MRKPVIGDTIYYPTWTCYRDKSRSAAPLTQFVVCKGVVKQIIHGGFTQYLCLVDLIDDETRRIYISPQLKDFGQKVFFDREHAVEKAEQMAADYTKKWKDICKEEFPLKMVYAD